ncbi:MAG: hypothetical protein V4723_19215 [Pseudomonadota bacterium]
MFDLQAAAPAVPDHPWRHARQARAGFCTVLALLLLAFLAWFPAAYDGDFAEYSVTTIALATHATPDLRVNDSATAARLAPNFAAVFGQLGEGIAVGREVPLPGFIRGRSGYFALHHWTYSALAAPAYLLLDALGAPPLKCFQALNLAMMIVLGMCLLRFFQSTLQAAAGLLLFAVCGGVLYWNWTGPEMLSAAGLLGAMLLVCSRAPLAAGLLAGLAATQNPSIAAFAAFGPVLAVLLARARGDDWRQELRGRAGWRHGAGALLTLVLAGLPFALSMWQFGEPSLIAKYSTSSDFVSWHRLHSFFLDLNQGMVSGVPFLMAAALLAGLRKGYAPLAAAAGVFTLLMALPALSAYNWNSGAVGMMRYAFWCAMPLLFAVLAALRELPRWPLYAGLLVLLQAGCMREAQRYSYVELNRVSQAVLGVAPQLYNPIAEIFTDRVSRTDAPLDESKVLSWRDANGLVVKTLFHSSNKQIAQRLCGEGAGLGADNRYRKVNAGWVYLNGPVRCDASARG